MAHTHTSIICLIAFLGPFHMLIHFIVAPGDHDPIDTLPRLLRPADVMGSTISSFLKDSEVLNE